MERFTSFFMAKKKLREEKTQEKLKISGLKDSELWLQLENKNY